MEKINETAFDAMMKEYEDALASGKRDLAREILNQPTPVSVDEPTVEQSRRCTWCGEYVGFGCSCASDLD